MCEPRPAETGAKMGCGTRKGPLWPESSFEIEIFFSKKKKVPILRLLRHRALGTFSINMAQICFVVVAPKGVLDGKNQTKPFYKQETHQQRHPFLQDTIHGLFPMATAIDI